MANYTEIYEIITEKKPTYKYRLDKFKKAHNYDPKTGTIEIGGTKQKFIYTGGSNKKIALPDAYNLIHAGRDSGIRMNTASFNQRHPTTSEFIANHEYGHAAEEKDKKKILRGDYGASAPTSLSGLMRNPKTTHIAKQMWREFKAGTLTQSKCDQYENRMARALDIQTNDADPVTSRTHLHNAICDIIQKHNVSSTHGRDSGEYKADYYATTHTKGGKKSGKSTLKDLARVANKQYKAKKGEFTNTNPRIRDLETEISHYNKMRKNYEISAKAHVSDSKNIHRRADILQSIADKAHAKGIENLYERRPRYGDKNGRDEWLKLRNDLSDNIKKMDQRVNKLRDIASSYNTHAYDDRFNAFRAKQKRNHGRDQRNHEQRKLNDLRKQEISGARSEINARLDAIDKLSKNKNADYIKMHK